MALYYRLLFPNQALRQLDDIEQLVPFMYLSNYGKVNTDEQQISKIIQNQPIENLIVDKILITEEPIMPSPTPILHPFASKISKDGKHSQSTTTTKCAFSIRNGLKDKKTQTTIYPKQPDSLFWCIYIARYGYTAYTEIGHRYGNIEIEEKQQIMEMMRKSPSKIKECPKKITKATYQEIMSDFMTNKKLTTEMLTIFSIYCNIRIWIINLDNSGEPDSWYMDICSNDNLHIQPIIIYCKNNKQYGINLIEREQLSELVTKIKDQLFCFDNYNMPLKAISNYKIMDLEDIAYKLGITMEGKYKKQDIYNKIIQKIALI